MARSLNQTPARPATLIVKVGIGMGSDSDWDVMSNAADILRDFGVPFEARVVSAHRTPDLLVEYGKARARAGSPA
jgi:5-(carboxyamino)imidazole ribonucleotide mutase